ncbi:HXXEE domain-containing protein [Paenarthrobacter nitroguajacolicus]|uniref:HXXEE domain-containing protein n=1 Tax=Paenarthrobacter nitroguajacolicus TaxID=211146 RepID=UPI00248CE520|nr:HXXEE domain-containing protein [Paenarthrobacter nitroguajacolicus]MDI2035158.1 hypothetical protein [Paenarthrobacter nitroguajacolicus]
MRWFLRHWYDIGGVLVIPTLLWAMLGNLPTLQLILVLNLAVIFIHQFEEYRFPGGEPWVLNEVFMRKGNPTAPVDRLPTNELSSIWINGMAWVLYFVAALFPDQVWLGLAPILMGFPAQFVVHGIITNRKLKAWYNPGLGAVVLGHLPLAIWYVVAVYQEGLIRWWDWGIGILLLGFFMGFVMQLVGFHILAPRGTEKHYYAAAEYNKWDRVRRLQRAGITPGTLSASE